jgi:predicted dehydrogenase
MVKLKYGLVGFGGIAENRIAKEGFACDRERFEPLPNAELTAAFDVNNSRQKAAEDLGLKWYDSLDKMLADSSLDAVFIATNNLSHAELAEKALNAGKHVIIEKPIATKVEDALRVSELAKSKGLSLAVDHMMTKNIYNRKAQKMLEAEVLGSVNDCCFHMEFCYGSTPEEAATWRCSKREELGGPIGDVASHCFYLAEFILQSRIVELACVYYPKMMDFAVEDGAYVKFKMADGRTGSVKVAFNEPRGGLGGTLSNLGYEIYGDKAALRGYGTMFQLSGFDDEPIDIRLELDTFKDVQNVEVGTPWNIYQGVISRHADSIINNQPMNGGDAVYNLKLIEAAHKSAQANGKIIRIS